MGEWKEYKIKDLGLVVTGKTPSSTFPEEFGSEMPFVTPTDFRNYRKRTSFAERNLSSKGIEKLRNKVLPPSSVLVTCIGSDMGKVVMNRVPVITNQQINAIIPNQELVSPDFLYYMLVDCYETLRMYSQAGTAVPILNKGDFEEINLTIPSDLSEQKTIASILSSLDDKIDLLHRQNKTLEALAETLFRQWFVKDANTEMVVLGSLVDVIDNRGKTPKYSNIKTDYPIVEVKSLSSQDRFVNYEACEKFVTEDLYKNWFRAGHPIKNDILFSTVGSIGEMKFVIENIGTIAQNVVGLRAKRISPFYLYQYLTLPNTRGNIKNLDIGAVQPSIKVPHLLEMEIPIPNDKSRIDKFERQLMPMFNKMKINHTQIRTLTRLRDTLLPKLMSEEVMVVF